MYNEILNSINNNGRIFCRGDEESQISHTIKLLLSQNTISNKTIIDVKENIDFIRSNLLIDESVILVPYQSDTEIAGILKEMIQDNKDFILIANSKLNLNKVSQIFDISIETNGKEIFVITKPSKESVVKIT